MKEPGLELAPVWVTVLQAVALMCHSMGLLFYFSYVFIFGSLFSTLEDT